MPRRRKRRKTAGALVRLESPEPQQTGGVQNVDLCCSEDWVPDSASEITGREKYLVEYHLFQTRPTDTENPYTKAMTDQLRYHGLLPNDDPYTVRVVVRLYKVKHRSQEGTKLVIKKLYE